MKRVRPLFYQALTSEPHFMYCCSVWDGNSQTLNDKLQKLQNLAARRIIKSSYDASSVLLLDRLGWDRVSISRTKQKEAVMFKTFNKQMPPYIQDMFSIHDVYYNIRRSENILYVPKPRTDYLKVKSWVLRGCPLEWTAIRTTFAVNR